jgi:hypothetical protein
MHGDQRRLRSVVMQGSNANGGATNTKVTQPLRLNVVILQGKRENTMHGAMLKYRNRFDDGDVIDVVALASCGLAHRRTDAA